MPLCWRNWRRWTDRWDEASEGRRNILVTPFWQQGDGTQDLAAELMQALAISDLALPGKFGFALDSGETAVLRRASADIRIEKAGETYLLLADGATLAAPHPTQPPKRSIWPAGFWKQAARGMDADACATFWRGARPCRPISP
jgi:hypothetical protein